MKQVLVIFPEELAKELDKYPNKSETLREAFRIYNGHITTDTVAGLRQSYKGLQKYMEGKFEYYDSVFNQLEKLINMLETRM